MEPEVQKILEELKKVTSSAEMAKFEASLKKSIKDLKAKGKLDESVHKLLIKDINAKKKLLEVQTNLQEHFKKFGTNLGLSEIAAGRFAKGTEKGTKFVSGFGTALYEGTGSIADFTDSLKAFGPIGETVARFGSTISGSLEMYRTLSSVGASFNQSLVELRETANAAALPLSDFVDLIGKNSENLAALYGSTTQGAREFSKLSETFRRSNIQFLAPLGLTVEEINEQLLTNLTLQRRTGRFEQTTTAQQIQSGMALIKQLDRLAKLTGIQRDQLASTVESQMSNERFLAFMNTQTEEVNQRLSTFAAGVGNLAPGLAEGFQDLIANAGVPVTEAARMLVMNIPEASGVIQQLTAGTITTEQAMVALKTAAIKSNKALGGVAQTGAVEFAKLYGEVNKLATAKLDLTAVTQEQRDQQATLTKELTQFEDASKRMSSAFQGVETSFIGWVGGFLGTGTGSLTDTMKGLTDDINKMSSGTQAGIYAAIEGIKTVGGMMRETAPITMGTYAALKLWGPLGPIGGGGGLGKVLGKAGKVAGGVARAGGVGIGLGGMMMGGNIADQSEGKAGKAMGVLSSAASGALIGSMVPIIGTALGAAIGGAYGLFRASDYDDKLFGSGDEKREAGTYGSTGQIRESRTSLATIHAGETVLNKGETDTYVANKTTGGDNTNLRTLPTEMKTMNLALATAVTEMKTFNKSVNTLIGINSETMKNTDRTQRRLANNRTSLV